MNDKKSDVWHDVWLMASIGILAGLMGFGYFFLMRILLPQKDVLIILCFGMVFSGMTGYVLRGNR